MLQFLKVFGRGVLTVILLPVILLIWVLHGIYCIGLFIFMFFKSTVDYFKGGSFNAEMTEDLEARRMLLEKEKQEEQAKDALSMMYQNAMSQTVMPPNNGGFDEPYNETYEENPEPFGSSEYESDADVTENEPDSADDEQEFF